jgi:NTP pyrophosphatase (non-canonical NTP hydrolase)
MVSNKYNTTEIKNMLKTLAITSKNKNESRQYAALNKVEEELIECLTEIRRVKNHFDETRSKRKNLNVDTYHTAIDALIDEMGDVYLDLFLYLPSIIEISDEKLEERIKYKLDRYKLILTDVYKIDPSNWILPGK